MLNVSTGAFSKVSFSQVAVEGEVSEIQTKEGLAVLLLALQMERVTCKSWRVASTC